MHLMKKNDHGTSHAEITSLTLTRLSDNEILIVDNLIGLKVSLLSWLCLCMKYMDTSNKWDTVSSCAILWDQI